jgi:hypothetical protein
MHVRKLELDCIEHPPFPFHVVVLSVGIVETGIKELAEREDISQECKAEYAELHDGAAYRGGC